MVTSNCRVALVLHAIVLLAASGTSFLLTDNCPAPCACSGSAVYCSNTGLNSLPLDISTWNSITYLDISINIFSVIPMAIGQMSSLQTLLINNNPILSLNKTIMQTIGDTLKVLSISLGLFNTWPTELRYLKLLATLTLHTIPFTHLPEHAFHGLESLTSLSITNSKLIKIPSEVICQLPNLNIFEFSSNTFLNDNESVNFEQCVVQSSLSTINLYNNNLRIFPNVLNVFPLLRGLYLQVNHIQYIEDQLIPRECDLNSLNLDFNSFTRIPFALTKCKQLSSLTISSNKITFLEEPDLMGLNYLGSLVLSNNPIVYISPHAFRYNPNLSNLQLQVTELGRVPEAVASLSHLNSLYLNGGKLIDCSCDMSYLKHWISKSVIIYGQCDSSSKNVTTFIKTSLQLCP